MNDSKTKLANFERLVINYAEQKSNEKLTELAEQKKKAVEKINEEITEKFQKELNAKAVKITKLKNKRIFQFRLECQQQILSKRQQLIDNLFEGVIKRLEEFVMSQRYKEYLTDSIAASKKRLEGATHIQICERDKQYAQEIEKFGLAIEYTNEPIIGGFVLIDIKNAVRLDDTLMTKAQNARDEFLERYNIKV
jgi:vacuolar-type H+-ATPase subunit E/Vma4